MPGAPTWEETWPDRPLVPDVIKFRPPLGLRGWWAACPVLVSWWLPLGGSKGGPAAVPCISGHLLKLVSQSSRMTGGVSTTLAEEQSLKLRCLGVLGEAPRSLESPGMTGEAVSPAHPCLSVGEATLSPRQAGFLCKSSWGFFF